MGPNEFAGSRVNPTSFLLVSLAVFVVTLALTDGGVLVQSLTELSALTRSKDRLVP